MNKLEWQHRHRNHVFYYVVSKQTTDISCLREKTMDRQFKKKHVYLFLLMLPASDDRMLSPSSSSLLRSSLFFAYTNRGISRKADDSIEFLWAISARCFVSSFKLWQISLILGQTRVKNSCSIT